MTGHTGDRDELATRLRALFDAAGMSTVRAARLLEERGVQASQSKVSRTLNGRVAAEPEFVAALCDLLGAPPAERDELVTLARQIRKATRRLVLGRDPAAAQTRIGKFQRESSVVRAVALTSVPGELQTEAYIRTIFDSDAGVRQRLLNQAVLDDEDSPRRFIMIIAESALGWTPLSPADMAQQVRHISTALARRNVRIGILKWGVPVPKLPQHSWYLFDSRLVVTGGLTYALDLSDPEDVTAYVTLTDQLEQLAVFDHDEVTAILNRTADRYDRRRGRP